ncbi:MAG: flagellar hook-basal body complex protein [Lachnospiraceae bacterium]|nr:flagellar hook-basal body complex protein [Lachnospiraceae bacterium]
MMRSLFSGVSGLKTHQTRMDVIGNNIANVNTTAYKSSSMVFSELISQTTQKASGPNAATGTGGVNARQIGLGVMGGAINVNITGQGAAQSTGNPFDIMISGSSFFVVNDGNNNFFTRDGSFYVDAAGNLAMTSNGYNVMGWQVDPETMNIKQDTVSALRIMSQANMTYPPEATSQAYVGGIIDKFDTDVTSSSGKTINLNFYDALGYDYTARLVIKQSSLTNEYSIELDKILDSAGNEIDISGATFGSATNQKINNTATLDNTAYRWNANVLETASGTAVCDLSTLFEAGSTLDNPVFKTDEDTTKALEELAKAYGYEGKLDDFMNLTVDLKHDPADTTTPTFTDGTYSVKQLLFNQQSGGNPCFTTPAAAFLDGPENWGLDSFDTTGRNFDGAMLVYNDGNQTGEKGHFIGVNGVATNQTVTLGLSGIGGNFSDIVIDFSTSSMFDNNGTCTVGATPGDLKGLGMGRKLGDMSGVSIQQNGMIYAAYDNGMTRLLGQIAVAEFANASGLERAGDNLYSATLNSGEFDGIGKDITASGGKMTTGQLEMSNVDLSAEFTEMITTQRGFQANSRIITVSDTLLEELTNLKR